MADGGGGGHGVEKEVTNLSHYYSVDSCKEESAGIAIPEQLQHL